MLQKIKILYVDDEETNRLIFSFSFRKLYEVLTAASGREGLDILNSNISIPIVITDLRMPEMNGLEFIELARKEHADKSFFILSGFDINSQIQNTIDKGWVKKFFSKPMQVSDIQNAIRESLEG